MDLKELFQQKYGGTWISYSELPPPEGTHVVVRYRRNDNTSIIGMTYCYWSQNNFDFKRLYPIEWLCIETTILPQTDKDSLIDDLKYEASFWKCKYFEASTEHLEHCKDLRKKYKAINKDDSQDAQPTRDTEESDCGTRTP